MYLKQSKMIDGKVGLLLKHKRLENEIVMRQVAIELGVTHSMIGKIERGDRRLSLGELYLYCEAIGQNFTIFIKKLTVEQSSSSFN